MWNVITQVRTRQPSHNIYTLCCKIYKHTLSEFLQWYWCFRTLYFHTPDTVNCSPIAQLFIFWRCITLRITIIVCFEKHLSFDIFHLLKKKITLRSHVLLKPLLAFVIWLFKTNNINSVKTSITNKNTFPSRLEWNRSETTIFLELVIKEEGSSLSAHDESGAWAVSTQPVWRDRPHDHGCD